MYKVYWLRSKNRHQKLYKYIRSGTFFLIFLALVFNTTVFLQASTSITRATIQKLESNSQGDVQKRYRAWIKLIDSLKKKPVAVQLEQVNSFFNQFRYQTQAESQGISDHWKTPDEFINAGGGDCKDYSIIKYFTLIHFQLCCFVI